MKFITTAAALIALASSATAAFSSCGSSTDSLKLTSVTYTPNPPKVGQNVCITLNGSLAKEVTAGSSIRVTATFWGMNVYDQTSDLCSGLVGGPNPCPVSTTVTSVTQCITVPSNVPAGVSLNLKAVATNADSSRIFCISGPLTFSN
ncbi:Phosphatidylglycerol/phosphatidylinositol transfer protein [Mortierella sp. GBA35]|nr:Phosphatidylglycerol/phosphatidylinositol transfer protein [Mortierella sp. AD031]KAF9104376.1 Phosphatidylglycerol/phosphatidylinositol transfer protein [Mortierella sp. GBA35]KAG0217335.1 Phosphatidylglycerol/phosphatidylinositol transfer protein [Mortierella sp. NVP41]